MSSNYVLYRMPHAGSFIRMQQTSSEPERLSSYSEIGSKDGFVFAPFSLSSGSPILLLRPDVVEQIPITPKMSMDEIPDISIPLISTERSAYHESFNKFHEHLNFGDFKKIVLSRSTVLHIARTLNSEELFFNACKLYPRMFIALVSMTETGTWLMATPEILLDGCDTQWHTMALAGTMRLTDDQLSFDTPSSTVPRDSIYWNNKNICEQRYVASYIRNRLKLFSNKIVETEPFTVRAGRLVHLRSDFNFKLQSSNVIGDVIKELHPTPAVCGIPRQETYDFILQNEGYDRKYYSGFSGIISKDNGTSLFVTLRCMEFLEDGYRLYAGGGLLKDSKEDSEWNETEAKMETMKKCIAIRKI